MKWKFILMIYNYSIPGPETSMPSQRKLIGMIQNVENWIPFVDILVV